MIMKVVMIFVAAIVVIVWMFTEVIFKQEEKELLTLHKQFCPVFCK